MKHWRSIPLAKHTFFRYRWIKVVFYVVFYKYIIIFICNFVECTHYLLIYISRYFISADIYNSYSPWYPLFISFTEQCDFLVLPDLWIEPDIFKLQSTRYFIHFFSLGCLFSSFFISFFFFFVFYYFSLFLSIFHSSFYNFYYRSISFYFVILSCISIRLYFPVIIFYLGF